MLGAEPADRVDQNGPLRNREVTLAHEHPVRATLQHAGHDLEQAAIPGHLRTVRDRDRRPSGIRHPHESISPSAGEEARASLRTGMRPARRASQPASTA